MHSVPCLDAKIVRAVTDGVTPSRRPFKPPHPPIIAGHDLISIAQNGTGRRPLSRCPPHQTLRATGSAAPHQGLGDRPDAPSSWCKSRRTCGRTRSICRDGGHGVWRRGRAAANPRLARGHGHHRRVPGRLLDLMGQRAADFSQVKFLVLDEGDRMLDMVSCRDIRRIVQQLPKQRQTLMFSASMSKEIEALTREFQHAPKVVQIGRRANPADTVTQLIYEVPQHLKTALLLHLLEDRQMDMVLVFRA